jgi:hypothetical protein
MTLGAQRMNTWMEPLQGGTILSSTHDTTLTEIDSDIGHDRFVRNSVGSSTREGRFTARRPTMHWLQACWSTKSPSISPRIMKRLTCMSSGSRRCWTQQQWRIRSMTRRMETRVIMMTTRKAFMGTRPAASLHMRRAEDAIETTVTYAMSFVP